MFVIAGLGNPGSQYESTRHNAGFLTIEYLHDHFGGTPEKLKMKGQISEINIKGEKVLLVRPQTYMNNSGECIREVLNFYKLDLSSLIVIYDDVDLPVGTIRVRPNGSAGTHNGMRSILAELKSGDFARVRIGIGKPLHPSMDLADYVLGRFDGEQAPVVKESIKRAAAAAEAIVLKGSEAAMNLYNIGDNK